MPSAAPSRLDDPVLPVSLLGLATAVPPHVIEQREVASRALPLFGAVFARYPGLADVFPNIGIERRFAAWPIDWYEQQHDWPERNGAYLDAASRLYAEAAAAALGRAGVGACDIHTVVTVSSTGIATPSLEARLAQRLGLPPNAARVPVFGLGCPGGVTGLSLAAKLARAAPGQSCCSWRLSSVRWPFDTTASAKPTSSPPPCLATAPQRPCCRRTPKALPACTSARASSTCGRRRSTSWAGRSIRRASV